MTKNEKFNDILKEIAACEYHLDILLTKTDELGGFGSYYPNECLKKLDIMKAAFELM